MLYAAERYDEAQITLQKALDLNPQATYIHPTLDNFFITGRKSQQALTESEKRTKRVGKTHGPSTGLSCARP
jgi:hypothetical protein